MDDTTIAELLGIPWDDVEARHRDMARNLLTDATPAQVPKAAQFAVHLMVYQGGYEGSMRRKLARRADQMLRELAEQGDAESQRELGQLLMERSDAAQAVLWLRRALEQGDARAAFDLGCLYEHHRGKVRRDLELSRHYFELAREMGYDR